MQIAFLGWGSLIWDPRPKFAAKIGPWRCDGPVLPVELCRISSSRKGALVLVIDRELGTEVPVLHAPSLRTDPADALSDLRAREGVSMQRIGFVNLLTGKQRGRYPEVVATIKAWAKQKDIQVVAWTDIESNFKSKESVEFSNEAALAHLKSLGKAGLREAVIYIVKAPQQVDTKFRQTMRLYATDEVYFWDVEGSERPGNSHTCGLWRRRDRFGERRYDRGDDERHDGRSAHDDGCHDGRADKHG